MQNYNFDHVPKKSESNFNDREIGTLFNDQLNIFYIIKMHLTTFFYVTLSDSSINRYLTLKKEFESNYLAKIFYSGLIGFIIRPL